MGNTVIEERKGEENITEIRDSHYPTKNMHTYHTNFLVSKTSYKVLVNITFYYPSHVSTVCMLSLLSLRIVLSPDPQRSFIARKSLSPCTK